MNRHRRTGAAGSGAVTGPNDWLARRGSARSFSAGCGTCRRATQSSGSGPRVKSAPLRRGLVPSNPHRRNYIGIRNAPQLSNLQTRRRLRGNPRRGDTRNIPGKKPFPQAKREGGNERREACSAGAVALAACSIDFDTSPPPLREASRRAVAGPMRGKRPLHLSFRFFAGLHFRKFRGSCREVGPRGRRRWSVV
jgi:hypothetical protein